MLRVCLHPIRVFCLHQVTEEFDPLRCFEVDWISKDLFMRRISEFRKEYSFISLPKAQQKLASDCFRLRNYAVLTFDDGYRSVLPTLKWLDSQGIPYTLFLNGKYMDGQSCSTHILENAKKVKQSITEGELSKGLYLNEKDIEGLCAASIGSHGYEHLDATELSRSAFYSLVKVNTDVLKNSRFPFVPFHSYTWGKHNRVSDAVLSELGLIPVLMDGQKNYYNSGVIHRELFPIY